MATADGRFVPADEDLDLPEPLGECPEVSVPMDPMTRRRHAIAELRELHKPVLPPGIERCGECDVVVPCKTIATLDKWGV